MEELLRIGAFCKRFHIAASTVRYYIHRGILIPETRNGQYLFSESCVQDMQQIMELKERDMPKKIKIIVGVPTCPVCGKRVVKCYDFCPDCGQKLEQ